jgi:hypothetical protein
VKNGSVRDGAASAGLRSNFGLASGAHVDGGALTSSPRRPEVNRPGRACRL